MSRKFIEPEKPVFLKDQAIYKPDGSKLGWVESVNSPFPDRPDLNFAVVRLCAGGTATYMPVHLAKGLILTKRALRDQGIARGSNPTLPPIVMAVGARVFSADGLYRGTIVEKSYVAPGELHSIRTDLHNYLSNRAFEEGRMRIGRRWPQTPK